LLLHKDRLTCAGLLVGSIPQKKPCQTLPLTHAAISQSAPCSAAFSFGVHPSPLKICICHLFPMQTTNDSGGPSANGQQQQQQQTASRPARSRNGCLTCRRRKVRCDEQRPRCSHCERLNLQCRWRPVYATPTASTSTAWRFINVGGGEASPDSRLAVQQQQQQQQFASPDESTSQQMPAAPATPSPSDGILGSGGISSPMAQAWLQNPGAVDQLFDYASFMWDPCGDQISPETTQPGVAQAYGSNVCEMINRPGCLQSKC
jgi:hypothetical protein